MRDAFGIYKAAPTKFVRTLAKKPPRRVVEARGFDTVNTPAGHLWSADLRTVGQAAHDDLIRMPKTKARKSKGFLRRKK